jgi:hypothetical protein
MYYFKLKKKKKNKDATKIFANSPLFEHNYKLFFYMIHKPTV